MNVQELLERNIFLEDEVHRCYQEIEEYEALLSEIREFLERKA
ncbi:hypothetical protein SAMN04487839_1184 [Streptococcus gallolyticus]|uniref:Uncharacterized protein n=1 Tax=Streptococcus gallolyticus TaxID=315405 RepID=A0A1H7XQP9_9STRE|nr:hypothetical protein SAMN02910295_0155 [Streptococcus gallolyticus]SEM36071.1 hypothetical protein SAMN04487839_1184 [Streptococcus gallolyticus]